MKKGSGSSQKLGSFLSPGAPNYRERNTGNQNGWSSERVLQPSSSSIRHQAGVANLTPFNSGRTIPSKWDDAERWICSPISGYSNHKTNSYAQLQRRPKSKSGPIVPPGTGYCFNYSPTIPMRQGLAVKNFMMVSSPFSTGVLAPDAISLHHYYAHDAVFGPPYDFDNSMQCSSPLLDDNSAALPSVSSAPVWSELLCEPSSPNSQDEKRNETKNEDALTSLSKCDRGTQMSPPETQNDAPKSSPTSTMNQQNSHAAKLEVRDVEVDTEATIIRWSKSHVPRLSLLPGKHSRKSSSTETQPSGLDIAESTLDSTKFETEESKIIAWESLQKAKAEAAMRKLEMKLEKKKSSSMEKILNKLRRAQMKAEKMRKQINAEQDQQQVSKTRKVFSFQKYAQIWSPRSCFSTHAP